MMRIETAGGIMGVAGRYKARLIAKLVRKAWLGHQAATNQRNLAS